MTEKVEPAGRSTWGHVQDVAVPGSCTLECCPREPSSSLMMTVIQEFSLAARWLSPSNDSSCEPMTEVKSTVAGLHWTKESGRVTEM